MKIINGTVENLNILLKKIYSLPVVYSLKKKENWKNDVSFYLIQKNNIWYNINNVLRSVNIF